MNRARNNAVTPCAAGFTLIELLVVLAIVSLLLTLAVPRYFNSIDKAKEAVLHDNLQQLRTVIDRFYGDTGRYPESLDELVERQYLRELPFDPITESNSTWLLVPPAPGLNGKIYNLRSGATGLTKDGRPYGKF
jgi:general secretion pathway protein G